MKKLLILAVGILSLPSFASVSANVSFTSDYIWRGMTQSDAPAIQGGFDFAAENGFYAGIWGSNVNFNNGAGSELDLYFGYGTEIGGVGVDVGYISYEYIDSDPDHENIIDIKETKEYKVKQFLCILNKGCQEYKLINEFNGLPDICPHGYQTNQIDCGIFTILHAEHISQKGIIDLENKVK